MNVCCRSWRGDGETIEEARNKTKRQNILVSSELIYDFLKSQKII